MSVFTIITAARGGHGLAKRKLAELLEGKPTSFTRRDWGSTLVAVVPAVFAGPFAIVALVVACLVPVTAHIMKHGTDPTLA